MGVHDDYGKALMSKLIGRRWSSHDHRRSIDEAGVRADLDGVRYAENGQVIEYAVEIEARVYKQIRGSIVYLALHPAGKKLLVVIKAQPQLGDAAKIEKHCNFIWQQIARNNHGEFAMAVLEGTGDAPEQETDLKLLKDSLQVLGLAL